MPSRQRSLAPLRLSIFRRMWVAGLLINFGQLIQSVGGSWAMTELTSDPGMIALVQSAAMLPMMIFALPAGAVADNYDRRWVAGSGVAFALLAAMAMALTGLMGLLTPWTILGLTFAIGSGIVIAGPAREGSTAELVPPAQLPAAIALNSISFNLARSFGPALGGLLVALAGTVPAFATNALLLAPMLIVLFLWNRVPEPARLPPEQLARAVTLGFRYVLHSPAIRPVIVRTFLIGMMGCALAALMPVIALDLLAGGPRLYGALLGSFGAGAVVAAFFVSDIKHRHGLERPVRSCAVIMAFAITVVALSRNAIVTAGALLPAGACWLILTTSVNIGVQTGVPRWVGGRVLAAWQTSVGAGIAIGSWLWGRIAHIEGVEASLMIAAAANIFVALAGLWRALPALSEIHEMAVQAEAPDHALKIGDKSGPIVIEVEYRVPDERAELFLETMRDVRRSRERNGAHAWTIARDMSDPSLWLERYRCPTWLDYLRQRDRQTRFEESLNRISQSFHVGPEPVRVRRLLELASKAVAKP